jgi:hypothetical protein
MIRSLSITPDEQARLDRILAIADLEPQRRIAYPFWALSAVLFVTANVSLMWGFTNFAIFAPFAFATFMIGMGRFGYYKLFRLLHYQNCLITDLRSSDEGKGVETQSKRL